MQEMTRTLTDDEVEVEVSAFLDAAALKAGAVLRQGCADTGPCRPSLPVGPLSLKLRG